MPRRKKEDALATREKLVDSAERCFTAVGVARTSMSAIAKGACVSRGAIYHHFQNKHELIEAVRHRFDQSVALRLGAESPGPTSGIDALFGSLWSFLRDVRTDERLRRSLRVIAKIDGVGAIDLARALDAGSARRLFHAELQNPGMDACVFGGLPPATVGQLIDDVMQGCLRRILEGPRQTTVAAVQSLQLLLGLLRTSVAVARSDLTAGPHWI